MRASFDAGSALPGLRNRSQYHSAYSPLDANAGTEYTPQWMKMPNLASLHHAGVGRLSTDSQVGSYRFVDVAASSALATSAEAPTSAHRQNTCNARTNASRSIRMKHLGHVGPPFLRRGRRPFFLHGLHERPPALRLRIRGHGAHVRVEIRAHVLEVREQDAVPQVDGIVADVGEPDPRQHARPNRGVLTHVLVSIFRSKFQYLPVSLHSFSHSR